MSRTTTDNARRGSESTGWLATTEAARYVGLSPSTLCRKRREGNGPPFRRPSRGVVRYRRAELDAWLGEQCYSTNAA